jgi:hypothetical protein
MLRLVARCAACLLVLAGCKVNPEVRTTPDDANAALIFGYYDMSDAPFELGCVRLTQDEKAGIAYRQSCMTTLKSGVFFVENVPPMKYHLPFFYAGGKLHMVSSSRTDVFDVPARSIYFLGSYKYKVIDRNLTDVLKLTPDKYGLNPVRSPDEAAVLRMLVDNVQSARWKQRIRARLAQPSR